jgi:hypothetical protein
MYLMFSIRQETTGAMSNAYCLKKHNHQCFFVDLRLYLELWLIFKF